MDNVFANLSNKRILYNDAGLPIYPPGTGFPVTVWFESDTHSPARAMNVDGSVTNQEYYIAPPANEIWQIDLIVLVIRATGGDPSKFGNGTALTNGIVLELRDGDIVSGTLLHDFTGGYGIRFNGELAAHTGEFNMTTFPGTTIISQSAAFKLSETYRTPINLDGSQNHRLSWVIRDNIVGTVTSMWSKATGSGWVIGS